MAGLNKVFIHFRGKLWDTFTCNQWYHYGLRLHLQCQDNILMCRCQLQIIWFTRKNLSSGWNMEWNAAILSG